MSLGQTWIPAQAGANTTVIPAQAGIHVTRPNMDPRLRGDDGCKQQLLLMNGTQGVPHHVVADSPPLRQPRLGREPEVIADIHA